MPPLVDGRSRWSSSRRRWGHLPLAGAEGAGGGVSRPLHVAAGGRSALIRCRVVSIRSTTLVPRACRYSTSGIHRWSSTSTSVSEGRCIETILGRRWGPACTDLLPGGLDTQGLRKLVPATRPAGSTAGRVPPRAPARGGVSRPFWADAGGRLARICCRVVSIRRDFASSSPLLDQRDRPLVECLHERQRGEVYRDHSGPTLGAGLHGSVAGWSRYAGTSQARPRYSTSGIDRWSSASTSASEGRCIETILGRRWGPACTDLLPGGLDTQGLRKLVPATRPAGSTAGRVPPRAPARGGVSRPFWADAGGRLARICCRVVSIRRDFASSSPLLDQRESRWISAGAPSAG
ncbi:hypothetical protein QE370_002919 [Aeromicrobium sp. SORGH_AS981]|nr:hypothetical protein [Aeromicrobium sp. SORGH_AS_0981]